VSGLKSLVKRKSNHSDEKSFSYAINPKGPLKGFFLFTLIVVALDLDGFFLVTEDGVRVIRCRSMTPTIRLLSFNPL
jgi:hypothetical protein